MSSSRVSFQRARPAQRMVAEQVREAIRSRGLRPGDLLPPYRQLAAEMGVAYMTVKRGIDDLAAEGLVQRVAAKGTFVAKELALVPRPLHTLGVINASSRAALFAYGYLNEIMHGAMLATPPATELRLFSLSEDGPVGADWLGLQKIDGVLLLGMENDEWLRTFAAWGTPGIVADYCPREAPVEHVACDNRAAARHVVAHLASLGHRRMAYLHDAESETFPVLSRAQETLMARHPSDTCERRAESLLAMADQGVQAAEWLTRDVLTSTGAPLKRLLAQPDHPTALLVADVFTAQRLLTTLQAIGVRVPQDISVCAVAGNRDDSLRHPVIAHSHFDFLQMGRRAIERLQARCLQPDAPLADAPRIGFQFVAGETIGAVRDAAKQERE